jgi:hypothetical protein
VFQAGFGIDSVNVYLAGMTITMKRRNATMSHYSDRLPDRIAVSRRITLFALCAFTLSACGRSQDTPAPPLTPKPQTKSEGQLPMGIKKAIFSYSSKFGSPYRTYMNQPDAAKHPAIVT